MKADHIRIDGALRAKVVPEVPEGWLALDEAAKALGIAGQTVLHEVQRAELAAVHVNRGQRNAPGYPVQSDWVGPFDAPS